MSCDRADYRGRNVIERRFWHLLQLGSDCVALVESKLDTVRDELDRWGELSLSTDYPDRSPGPMPPDPHGRGTTPLRRASNSRSRRVRWSSTTALGGAPAVRRRAVSTITVP